MVLFFLDFNFLVSWDPQVKLFEDIVSPATTFWDRFLFLGPLLNGSFSKFAGGEEFPDLDGPIDSEDY